METQKQWHAEDGMVFDERGFRMADCECDDQEESRKDVEARARFIAAAPDLLTECKRAQDELASAIRDGVQHLDKAMLERWYKGVSEAIAKAKAA